VTYITQLWRTQANSGTQITGSNVNYHAGTTPTRMRMRCVGTTLQYKIWPAASAEPASWTATVTDSTYSAAGAFGIAMSSGNSLASQTVYLDNLTITDGSITSNQTVVPAFKVLQRGKAALAAAATSLTVSLPGAATPGTTQVVVLTTSSGSGIGTLPAGWTNRASRTDRLNNLYILDHATTATTDTSATFTFPNGVANAYIIEAQGIIAPDTVVGTGGAGPSASYTTGTLTPTIGNTWLLVGTDYTTNTSTAFSAPVAFRDQQYTSVASFSNIHSAYADGTITSLGPDGNNHTDCRSIGLGDGDDYLRNHRSCYHRPARHGVQRNDRGRGHSDNLQWSN
jgi:hypothetical protein